MKAYVVFLSILALALLAGLGRITLWGMSEGGW